MKETLYGEAWHEYLEHDEHKHDWKRHSCDSFKATFHTLSDCFNKFGFCLRIDICVGIGLEEYIGDGLGSRLDLSLAHCSSFSLGQLQLLNLLNIALCCLHLIHRALALHFRSIAGCCQHSSSS